MGWGGDWRSFGVSRKSCSRIRGWEVGSVGVRRDIIYIHHISLTMMMKMIMGPLHLMMMMMTTMMMMMMMMIHHTAGLPPAFTVCNLGCAPRVLLPSNPRTVASGREAVLCLFPLIACRLPQCLARRLRLAAFAKLGFWICAGHLLKLALGR